MTDNFMKGDGELRVRTPKGSIKPVPIPKGFTEYMFRNLVAATDTLFRQNGVLPNAVEVQRMWPRAPINTITSLMVTDEFKQALEYRGVQWDIDSGLSMEQSMALMKLTDPTDRRTTAAKLRELGIPMARYQAWMKWPLFAENYRRRSEDNLREAIPLALNKLVANVENNDQRAIEKLLEVTGRYDPNNRQIEDMKVLVTKLVEAVIEHTTPEQREAILSKISLHTAMIGGINSQRRIEG